MTKNKTKIPAAIAAHTGELCSCLESLSGTDEKIDALNYIRMKLHGVSPLRHHPVDFVAWERPGSVQGNDYNPNSVAPPEMQLLVTSIEQDGYTMPVVTSPEQGLLRIVDGFHRRQAGIRSQTIAQSTFGRLPVTFIREGQRAQDARMASTIRHNRARGSHSIDLMSEIVRELVSLGRSVAWIRKHIGMDTDEILRLKQLTGLAELFAGEAFSFPAHKIPGETKHGAAAAQPTAAGQKGGDDEG